MRPFHYAAPPGAGRTRRHGAQGAQGQSATLHLRCRGSYTHHAERVQRSTCGAIGALTYLILRPCCTWRRLRTICNTASRSLRPASPARLCKPRWRRRVYTTLKGVSSWQSKRPVAAATAKSVVSIWSVPEAGFPAASYRFHFVLAPPAGAASNKRDRLPGLIHGRSCWAAAFIQQIGAPQRTQNDLVSAVASSKSAKSSIQLRRPSTKKRLRKASRAVSGPFPKAL